MVALRSILTLDPGAKSPSARTADHLTTSGWAAARAARIERLASTNNFHARCITWLYAVGRQKLSDSGVQPLLLEAELVLRAIAKSCDVGAMLPDHKQCQSHVEGDQ